jgi:hypothetical protein
LQGGFLSDVLSAVYHVAEANRPQKNRPQKKAGPVDPASDFYGFELISPFSPVIPVEAANSLGEKTLLIRDEVAKA